MRAASDEDRRRSRKPTSALSGADRVDAAAEDHERTVVKGGEMKKVRETVDDRLVGRRNVRVTENATDPHRAEYEAVRLRALQTGYPTVPALPGMYVVLRPSGDDPPRMKPAKRRSS
jgi:hypothetical protein